MHKIVLASKSPRRKELLQNIGVSFSVCVTDTDESIVPKNLNPGLYVCELSLLKANAAAKVCDKDTFIVGADTVVVDADGNIIGKPADKEDAFNILMSLSGKVHSVYTGVTVVDTNDMHAVSRYEKTDVTFRKLSEKEIIHYIDSCNVLDKAGAYGIQDYAGVFVSRIEGDYFNIVGLPLCLLATMISNEFGEELI